MFLSTFDTGLDDKRRLTVPATIRAVLKEKVVEGVYIWRSFRGQCLEGAGHDYVLNIKAKIDAMDEFDPVREALEVAFLGDVRHLAFDAGGRVVLTEDFVEFAGLKERVACMGVGNTFQIWHPERLAERQKAAIELAGQLRGRLGVSGSGGGLVGA